VKRSRRSAIAGILLCGVAGAASGDDELARCAAIDAPDARLACFDALAARSKTATPPASSATAPSPTPVWKSALAPAAAAAAPAPAAASATAAPAAPAAGNEGQNFGLNPVQLHIEPTGPASIEATVSTVTESRNGQTSVRLDNAQTWIIEEADVRLVAGDKVMIKRAALGSYLLLAPSRHAYRVRRAQ
jgi:hypothetical protein